MTDQQGEEMRPGRYLRVNMTLNERNFVETPAVYATIPNVSFDGTNFHLVFLTATPTPIADVNEHAESRVSVAARLVLPPITMEVTIQAMIDALTNPVPVGPLTQVHTQGEGE